MKKSLYTPENYQDCVRRLNQLDATAQPQWGKMNVAQMMAHCSEAQQVASGAKPLTNTPLFFKLIGGVARFAVLSKRPFPKGVMTHPQYIPAPQQDFEAEKARLLAVIEKFHAERETAQPLQHPMFGTLSVEERGWLAFKHLDHHLKQFGV